MQCAEFLCAHTHTHTHITSSLGLGVLFWCERRRMPTHSKLPFSPLAHQVQYSTNLRCLQVGKPRSGPFLSWRHQALGTACSISAHRAAAQPLHHFWASGGLVQPAAAAGTGCRWLCVLQRDVTAQTLHHHFWARGGGACLSCCSCQHRL